MIKQGHFDVVSSKTLANHRQSEEKPAKKSVAAPVKAAPKKKQELGCPYSEDSAGNKSNKHTIKLASEEANLIVETKIQGKTEKLSESKVIGQSSRKVTKTTLTQQSPQPQNTTVRNDRSVPIPSITRQTETAPKPDNAKKNIIESSSYRNSHLNAKNIVANADRNQTVNTNRDTGEMAINKDNKQNSNKFIVDKSNDSDASIIKKIKTLFKF